MTTKPAPAESEQLTVEQALIELRETMPDVACFQVTQTAWYYKDHGVVRGSAKIIAGDALKEFRAPTLNEAMDQVRQWREEQHAKEGKV